MPLAAPTADRIRRQPVLAASFTPPVEGLASDERWDLEMAESSADKWEYENKIAQRIGFEQHLELPIPMPIPQRQEAAN